MFKEKKRSQHEPRAASLLKKIELDFSKMPVLHSPSLDSDQHSVQDSTSDHQNQISKLRSTELLKSVCTNIYKKGFMNGLFSDITVSALGMQYHLHKLILIQSPYFASMLEGSWKEQDQSLIELQLEDPHLTVESLTIMFARLYGETQSKISLKNATSLLAAGVFFDDSSLCELAVEFVTQHMDPHSVVEYLMFSDNFDYGSYSQSIKDACLAFICSRDFKDLVPILSRLPFDWLSRFVSCDCLNVASEFQRYKLITNVLDERESLSETSEIGSTLEESLNDLDICVESTQDDMDTLFKNAVVFTNMSFEELEQVRDEGIVSDEILKDALWEQKQTELQIKKKSLLKSETEDERTVKASPVFIPQLDTDKMNKRDISQRIMAPPIHSIATHSPPFRFAVEFKDLDQITDRLYSEPVWYAGSYWRSYVQMPIGSEQKLGIYLQRLVSFSSAFPRDSHPYMDHRESVGAWFQIYGFLSNACYLLESRPDQFKDNQSWGWQSQTLYKELVLQKGKHLKCAIIIGLAEYLKS